MADATDFTMSDSDDDWFNTDENKLVKNLTQQMKLKVANELHEERIEFCSKLDDYRKQSSSDVSAPRRFTTGEFANALKMPPLEMFLYFMAGRRNLNNQFTASDSPNRLSKYVQVLTVLGQLELGGFNEQLLSAFANQPVLMDHLQRFALKIIGPPFKNNMDAETELTLHNILWLLERAHKLCVLKDTACIAIDQFKRLIDHCTTHGVFKQRACVEFAYALETVPTVKSKIFPNLEDLLRPETIKVIPPATPGNVSEYINRQRLLLCEDFLQPLREFVKRLYVQENIDALVKLNLVIPHTQLVLNPNFANAERHSLIFMDSMPAKLIPRNKNLISNIKTGALLCFTSSYDFDNLILATVSYTDPKMLSQGYLSVEIAKQYNIGNIYEKPLIMFETPVFFEPYLRVHNYLSTCSADNFPMRDYIIKQNTIPFEVRPPAYIRPDAQLKYNGKVFTAAKPPKETQLNDVQRMALGAALTNEFCLIQGPPGTGKTHLSVELINTLLQNAKHLNLGPIIVLTYTNDALDKFLLKVAKHTDSILRFGSQSRHPEIDKYNVLTKIDDVEVPASVKRLWWLVKCEYKEQFELLQALHANFDGSEESYAEIQAAQNQLQLVAEKINTLRNIFQYYVARNKSLLAMTTTCAARLNYLFRLLQSKCFIFEEAAETAESHVLACLTPYTKHVLLIGDHKQLQPHTGNHALQGIQISLFERLINEKFPVSVLNTQYRMRSCIAELLVPIFYDELISDNSVLEYDNVPNISTNMYFVNHVEPEEQLTDMSFVNKYEAKQLVTLLRRLKAKPSNVVILTPYKAQVEYIKCLLSTNKFLVATVDSYQGLEAKIVLLSLVRSNPNGQIGFLRQPNRVCVALSRARWALYMIGNMDTLQHGNPELWGAINRKLQAANAIGGEFPFIADDKKSSKTKRH